MLKIQILRNKKSYAYKADTEKPDSFENNWKNNSLDWLVLLDDKAELFRCRAQTVANYCFGKMATADTIPYGDTVRVGSFHIRCFADSRNFAGEIHEIIDTVDTDGQRISHEAMQLTKDGFQTGRWLIHSRYSKSFGRDTKTAWSAGCFITSSADLEAFNAMLHAYKVQCGEILSGEVIEE